MLRLSFIVPFYNVEPYIEGCIRSLYNQDIPQEKYEVICIDDCSPDGSRAIVERLQQEYPTLKLLRTPENLRQGGARNMGLDVAQGRYVWFVDSDDYIKPNCLAYLLDKADANTLDILNFNFEYCGSLKHTKQPHPHYELSTCTGTEYVFDRHYRWANKCCVVTNAIILNHLLQKHNLRFAEKVQFEDCDYGIKLYMIAKRVMHINFSGYVYRIEVGSTVNAPASNIRLGYTIMVAVRYAELAIRNCFNRQWYKALCELIRYTIYEANEVRCELPPSNSDNYPGLLAYPKAYLLFFFDTWKHIVPLLH